MYETITIQKLSTGSIFKLTVVGMLCAIIPLSVFFGFFALFGASTVKWNNQPITGFAGLAASPFIGVFIALVFTALMGTFAAFGLWLFSKFRSLQIDVKGLIHGSQQT